MRAAPILFLLFSVAGLVPLDAATGELTLISDTETSPSALPPQPPASAPASGVRMTLEQCVLSAVANNLEIVVERSKPRGGVEDITALEAEFDPSVFATLGYFRNQTPSSSAFSDPAVAENKGTSASVGLKQKFELGTSYKLTLDTNRADTNSSLSSLNPTYTSNLELAVTQPLMKNYGRGANGARLVISRNTQKITEEQFAAKVMDIVSKTAQAYWDFFYLRKELEVQEEALRRAKDLQKQIELKVAAGVLAPIEVTAVQAQVAAVEVSLLEIRNAIGNARDNLKALVNSDRTPLRSDADIAPADEPEFRKSQINAAALIETAFERRPDYRQAALALESKKTELGLNENQSRPQLDLVGAVKFHGVRGTNQTVIFGGGPLPASPLGGSMTNSFSDITGGKYYDYSIGLQFEIPLGNRAAKSRLAKSMVETDAANMQIALLKQSVELQVLAAARDAGSAELRMAATRASRILAEKKLESETKKYEVGSSTAFTVLQYQNDAAAERSKELKALTDYLKAIDRLDLAVGTTLDRYNITIAQPTQ